MTKADASEFEQAITAAIVVFNKPADPAVIAIYWRVLKPYQLDEVVHAINRAVATETDFFPLPGALRADIRTARKRRLMEERSRELLAGPPVRFQIPEKTGGRRPRASRQ